jgi:hypothetical protein
MRKYIFRKARLLLAAIVLIVLFTGCTRADYSARETKLALIKPIDPKPTVFVKNEDENKELKTLEKVRKEMISMEPVYDVAIVKGGNDTLIAYKVKHMHRFRMKQIEKEINKRLEEKFPKENFTVSSDYKIFLEVVELINDKKNPDYSDKRGNKKLQKIIRLQEQLT